MNYPPGAIHDPRNPIFDKEIDHCIICGYEDENEICDKCMEKAVFDFDIETIKLIEPSDIKRIIIEAGYKI